MPNVQLWIKDADYENFKSLLEKLSIYHEEVINYSAGFDPGKAYIVVKGYGKGRKGHRMYRECVGKGFVVMEALEAKWHYIVTEDLFNNPLWSRDRDGYRRLRDLAGNEFRQAAKERGNPAYGNWLQSRGIENSWESWKEYRKEYPPEKKPEEVKKFLTY